MYQALLKNNLYALSNLIATIIILILQMRLCNLTKLIGGRVTRTLIYLE